VRLEVSGGGFRVSTAGGRRAGPSTCGRSTPMRAVLGVQRHAGTARSTSGITTVTSSSTKTSHEDDNAFLLRESGFRRSAYVPLLNSANQAHPFCALLVLFPTASCKIRRASCPTKERDKGSPNGLTARTLRLRRQHGTRSSCPRPARSSDKNTQEPSSNLQDSFRSGQFRRRTKARTGRSDPSRARCDVDPLGQRDVVLSPFERILKGTRRGVAGVGVRGPTAGGGGTCAMNGPAV